jgi:hypothetical protein
MGFIYRLAQKSSSVYGKIFRENKPVTDKRNTQGVGKDQVLFPKQLFPAKHKNKDRERTELRLRLFFDLLKPSC